jgi:hypothetical protein
VNELFDIGGQVSCNDGPVGTLVCVVLDPIARTVTHVVVEPHHAAGQGRLVPVELIEQRGDGLALRCDGREFAELEFAEETHFTSPDGEDLGYREGEIVAWPYYGMGLEMGASEVAGTPRAYFASRVPAGQVEVRRGERVHAADGDLGRVRGFVVDPADHHITHLVLEEGHLFSRREVAVPIDSVTAVEPDGVTLSLTRDQIRALPTLEPPV